jgi:hypothetical protein
MLHITFDTTPRSHLHSALYNDEYPPRAANVLLCISSVISRITESRGLAGTDNALERAVIWAGLASITAPPALTTAIGVRPTVATSRSSARIPRLRPDDSQIDLRPFESSALVLFEEAKGTSGDRPPPPSESDTSAIFEEFARVLNPSGSELELCNGTYGGGPSELESSDMGDWSISRSS